MKKWLSGLVAGLMLSFATAVSAQDATPAQIPAEDTSSKIDVSLSLDLASKYMSKGKVINNEPVMFGDLTLSYEGFYAGVWGAYDLTEFYSRHKEIGEGSFDSERQWRFEEIDYYIGYYYTLDDVAGLGPLTIDLSWTYFHYPTVTEWNSAEIKLSFTLDELYKTDTQCLSATLAGAHDYELEESWINLGGVYTIALDADEMFELELSADLYWGDTKFARCYSADSDAFTTAVIGAALNINLCDCFTLTPYIQEAYALDSRVRQYMRDDFRNNRQNFMAGLKASFSF